jgi:hypothetical protein
MARTEKTQAFKPVAQEQYRHPPVTTLTQLQSCKGKRESLGVAAKSDQWGWTRPSWCSGKWKPNLGTGDKALKLDWPREPALPDLLKQNQNPDEESASANLLMKTSGRPGGRRKLKAEWTQCETADRKPKHMHQKELSTAWYPVPRTHGNITPGAWVGNWQWQCAQFPNAENEKQELKIAAL